MALTTACTDSPSKLKLAVPVVAGKPGGGREAAPRLMVWPVPRRICALGPSSSALLSRGSCSTPLWVRRAPACSVCGPLSAAGSPSRFTRGETTLAHEANCVAMIAATRAWVAYC